MRRDFYKQSLHNEYSSLLGHVSFLEKFCKPKTKEELDDYNKKKYRLEFLERILFGDN